MVMDELFKKLKDFETEGSQGHSDWNSFEKALDKKDKKGFLWINLSVIILILFIPLELHELAIAPDYKQFATNTSSNSELVNEPSINDLKVDSRVMNPGNEAAPNNLRPTSSVQLKTSGGSNKSSNPQKTYVSSNQVQEVQEKNNDIQKQLSIETSGGSTKLSNPQKTYVASIPALEGQEKSNDIQKQLPDSESSFVKTNDNQQKPILTSEVIADENIETDENTRSEENANVDSTPSDKEDIANSFGLDVGIKSSFVNGISDNPETPYAWGIGGFLDLKYNIGRSFAIGFEAGITSEFNQNLNYSYVSEARSFMQLSQKSVHIDTKQIYSASLNLSANYKWNKKLMTGVGIYYNTAFQTVSEIRESGTGSYSNIEGEIVKKTGYYDLLNRNEIGLSLSQTYRPNENWGLTFSYRKGLNSRVNANYFPSNTNKRSEFSLMISRRIL
jgi:hypothetical protein